MVLIGIFMGITKLKTIQFFGFIPFILYVLWAASSRFQSENFQVSYVLLTLFIAGVGITSMNKTLNYMSFIAIAIIFIAFALMGVANVQSPYLELKVGFIVVMYYSVLYMKR